MWYIRRYIQHLPDPARSVTETKNHTIPVQFQYSAQYSTHNEYSTDRNSFQDHHTFCTSYDSKAGRSSTCTYTSSAKYSMEGTSSTLYTCPQATEAGLQTRGIISLEKSQAPVQWKDCEQTPIDKARHSVTLFWLL